MAESTLSQPYRLSYKAHTQKARAILFGCVSATHVEKRVPQLINLKARKLNNLTRNSASKGKIHIMSWDVRIFFQERGTKKETWGTVSFETRDEALGAVTKLEHDVQHSSQNDLVVIESSRNRISFVAQDFRRTSMFENSGPIIA